MERILQPFQAVTKRLEGHAVRIGLGSITCYGIADHASRRDEEDLYSTQTSYPELATSIKSRVV